LKKRNYDYNPLEKMNSNHSKTNVAQNRKNPLFKIGRFTALKMRGGGGKLTWARKKLRGGLPGRVQSDEAMLPVSSMKVDSGAPQIFLLQKRGGEAKRDNVGKTKIHPSPGGN